MTGDVSQARLDMKAREEMARDREVHFYTVLCVSCNEIAEDHLGFEGELDPCQFCASDNVVRVPS